MIDKYDFRADPEQTTTALEYPAPKNVKQLKSFLGMVGWYSRFIPNFAKIKLPLIELTKNEVE